MHISCTPPQYRRSQTQTTSTEVEAAEEISNGQRDLEWGLILPPSAQIVARSTAIPSDHGVLPLQPASSSDMVKTAAPGTVRTAVRSGGAGAITHDVDTGQATHATADITKATPISARKVHRDRALPAARIQRLTAVLRRHTVVCATSTARG